MFSETTLPFLLSIPFRPPTMREKLSKTCQKTVVIGDRKSSVRADPRVREKRENGMRKCAKNGSLKTFLLGVCFNLSGKKLALGVQNGPWRNGRGKNCPCHQPAGRNNSMKLPASKSEPVEHARAFKVQRYALAASIILGPLSVALFV